MHFFHGFENTKKRSLQLESTASSAFGWLSHTATSVERKRNRRAFEWIRSAHTERYTDGPTRHTRVAPGYDGAYAQDFRRFPAGHAVL